MSKKEELVAFIKNLSGEDANLKKLFNKAGA